MRKAEGIITLCACVQLASWDCGCGFMGCLSMQKHFNVFVASVLGMNSS